MATRREDYWRSLINGMKSAPLPSDGREQPEIEKIPPRTRRKKQSEDIEPSERKVMVQKITTEIYIMTDSENRKFASVSKQQTHIIGEMTLEEAMKQAQNGS